MIAIQQYFGIPDSPFSVSTRWLLLRPAYVPQIASLISPGVKRIFCQRAVNEPYSGTVSSEVIHGQANFKPGKIYFAHQNLVRWRLEIIELPDDFKLPQSSIIPLLSPEYDKAFQEAERLHRASLIPSLSPLSSETK